MFVLVPMCQMVNDLHMSLYRVALIAPCSEINSYMYAIPLFDGCVAMCFHPFS